MNRESENTARKAFDGAAYRLEACRKLLREIGASWIEREDGKLRVEGDLNLRNTPRQIYQWPELTYISVSGRLICGEYQEQSLRTLKNMPDLDNPNAVVRTRNQPAPPPPPSPT